MGRKIFLTALILTALYAVAFARIIKVPNDYTTIQSGIDASADGDTVLVAPGTYTGIGNRDIDLGGRRILLKTQRGSDSTIINCEGNPSEHRGFYFHSDEDSMSIVDGFTIRQGYTVSYGAGISCDGASPKIINCQFVSNNARFGGGISCRGNSQAFIENCAFSQNFAISYSWPANGGGIYCESSAVVITECTFTGNNTFLRIPVGPADGAGIYCEGSPAPVIRQCAFELNNAWTYGGGLFCRNSAPSVEDCQFDSNYADSHGGAISCENSEPAISGCRFTRGFGRSDAGAIYCDHSTPIVENCSFDNNHCDSYGAAVSCYSGSSATFINCSFRNHAWLAFYGGAIYCEASFLYLQSCDFARNVSQDRGGAVCLLDAEGLMQGCQFDSNAAVQGAAICFIRSDQVTVSNCIFNHDTTDSDAGAVYCQNSSPTFRGSSFMNNVAGFGAGAKMEFESSPLFENCLFAGNSGYTGAGIGLSDGASATIVNSVFYGNSAGAGATIAVGSGCNAAIENTILSFSLLGNAIQCYDTASIVVLSYCDIFGNRGGDWVGCIENQLGIRGNISVNPDYRNYAQHDFRLKSVDCGYSSNSPCIDAGDPNILDSLLDCSWGLGAARSDIGAYGGGDSVGVGIDEAISELPNHFSISQNYPNPFNPTTTISYNLSQSAHVTLEIYDILGRKVETLVDKEQPVGSHQAVWNAGDRASGIYFYRLVINEQVATKAMLLLK